MNLKFSTNFVVMPSDCNYHFPMIFGGAFFSKLDLAAACAVSRLLHDSECDSAVTHKVENLEFLAPAECGDIIFIDCEIVELRKKSVVVAVIAKREKRAQEGQDLIAKANFVFVTKLGKQFHPHGLSLQ